MREQRPLKERLIVSHDSATRLRAATEWLNGYSPDAEILIVSATKEASDEFARNAAMTAGARFGLSRFTLNHLAATLAAAELARAELVPASGLALTAVSARSIHLLNRAGALAYFG